MNHLTIMGNLGNDPETRFTTSGQKVTTFRAADNQRRGGKDETLWWRITIWGEQFDKMIAYLKRGSAVIVTGEMSKPEIYQDREGKPQISLNMTAHHLAFSPFGRSDKASQQEETANAANAHVSPPLSGSQPEQIKNDQKNYISQGEGDATSYEMSEDEIPF